MVPVAGAKFTLLSLSLKVDLLEALLAVVTGAVFAGYTMIVTVPGAESAAPSLTLKVKLSVP